MLSITKRLTPFLLLGFTLFLVASCEGPRTPSLRADSPEVVERARMRVLEQLPTLDGVSRAMIQTNAPKIEYVGVSFYSGNYTFIWEISSNRMATLDSFGTLEKLDDKPVRVEKFFLHSSH